MPCSRQMSAAPTPLARKSIDYRFSPVQPCSPIIRMICSRCDRTDGAYAHSLKRDFLILHPRFRGLCKFMAGNYGAGSRAKGAWPVDSAAQTVCAGVHGCRARNLPGGLDQKIAACAYSASTIVASSTPRDRVFMMPSSLSSDTCEESFTRRV